MALTTCSCRLLGATVLLLVPCLAFGVAGAATVSVVAPDTAVTVHDSFVLRLVTTEQPDLKAYHLIFTFDPAVIRVVAIEPGDVLTGTGRSFVALVVPDRAPPADSLWYDCAMLDGSTAGPGVLAYVRFEAVAIGNTAIRCEEVDFRDSRNARSLPACEGGSVRVFGPTPAPTTTWGRIKTLYR